MSWGHRIDMGRSLSMRAAALERASVQRPTFRLANQTTPAQAIARDEAHEARQRLQSLLFALEVAGVGVDMRQVVADAIDDIEQLARSL